MTTWTVTEITLSADYMSQESDTLTIPCRSLSWSPPELKVRSGAGDFKLTSVVKQAVISAIGVDASIIRPLIGRAHRLTFRESITGSEETFEITLVRVSPQNEVSFVVKG
jgi:hypothetical protein